MRAVGLLALALPACTTYLPPQQADLERDRDGVATLVITELMIDPTACPDDEAEWIEVTNVSSETIDLAGYQLVDASGVTVDIDAEYLIEPGDVMQIGRGSWDSFCVGQIHPHAYYGASLSLNNDAEQLSLLDPDGNVVDVTPLFTGHLIEPGSSVSLSPDAIDPDANDLHEAWYVGSDCANTAGTSPDRANPSCIADLGWFGLDCAGCALPDDFDPVPYLHDAHQIASGALDRRLDIDRDGVFFHQLRLDNEPAVDPGDWVAGDAHWTVTFVTYGDDLWGYNNLFATIDINAGTVVIEERYASSSLAKVREDELASVAMNATEMMEALDDSWGWWDDVGFATLNRASYQDTLRWNAVDDRNDDRQSYDATTGELVR